jgi:hypothetical protein
MQIGATSQNILHVAIHTLLITSVEDQTHQNMFGAPWRGISILA